MKAFYELKNQPASAFRSANMTFPEHLHKEMEIIYIMEGELDVQIGAVRKTLGREEIGVIFPNTIHSYDTKNDCHCILLIFSIGVVGDYEDTLTRYSCLTPFPKKDLIHKDVPVCLESLLREDISGNIPLVKGYLSVLLGNLLPFLTLEKKTIREEYRTVDAVLHYVMEHYKEPVTLEDVANDLGIGRYTVSRIFNQQIKCGFNEYINHLRIGYAQHLLENPEISVTFAALESGFSSQRTFNRIFKELHGISPREYRSNITSSSHIPE